MKLLLMHPDRDFDMEVRPPQADALVKDLELDTLFAAMAGGDEFLLAVAKPALLQSLTDVDAILWRQEVLQDCETQRETIEALYQLAVDTLAEEHKHFYFEYNSASGNLMQGIETLQRCHARLRTLRRIADGARAGGFRSRAFIQVFETLHAQLDDAYLDEIAAHLEELRFKYGTLASARLGRGNKSIEFMLHNVPRERRGHWRHWLLHQPETYAFEIAPRDDAGAVALGEVRDHALRVAADAVSQSANQVLAFFTQLRIELAFYRGALNLKAALQTHGMGVCRPTPSAIEPHDWQATGLYDPCLCLIKGSNVDSNDLAAAGADLVFVTGANQGGKSTFLRSIGAAQLLMQAGLFVPAESFAANICSGVFTHYKREEDARMESGKFDEELVRMDGIVGQITAGALVLFNESFAATNEHEGAAIAAEIIDVFMEKRIKVVFVTHFYELALDFSESGRTDVLFLAAERTADGTRTHRILPGRPSRTAYGPDLYARIFADDPLPPAGQVAAVVTTPT